MSGGDFILSKRHAVWLFSLIMLVPVITGKPPCTKPGFYWWLGFASIGLGLPAALTFMAGSLEKMRAYVRNNILFIEYSLGRILIPTGIIADAEKMESLGPMVRVGGASIPGLIDAGYYYSEALGKIKAMITRRKNLILIKLKNNAKILLSPSNPEALIPQLKQTLGKGPEAPIKVQGKDTLLALLGILIIFLAGITAYQTYMQLPEKVPVHYTSHWKPDKYGSKETLLNVTAILLFLSFLFLLISLYISRSIPGFTLISLPVVLGLSLILMSMITLPLCIE